VLIISFQFHNTITRYKQSLMKASLSLLAPFLALMATAQQPENSKKIDFDITKNRKKTDSLTAVDWLAYPYKYLDSDYKITATQDHFQQMIKKGDFYKERITTYEDSLGVVLYEELKDWQAARIANLRITYSWQRVGWHLFLNEKEAQQLAQSLGFKLPYRAINYLKGDTIQEPKRVAVINKLRDKLVKLDLITPTSATLLSDKALFDLAFKHNPERVALEKKARARRQKSADQKD